jgi:hypothetical protein
MDGMEDARGGRVAAGTKHSLTLGLFSVWNRGCRGAWGLTGGETVTGVSAAAGYPFPIAHLATLRYTGGDRCAVRCLHWGRPRV